MDTESADTDRDLSGLQIDETEFEHLDGRSRLGQSADNSRFSGFTLGPAGFFRGFDKLRGAGRGSRRSKPEPGPPVKMTASSSFGQSFVTRTR